MRFDIDVIRIVRQEVPIEQPFVGVELREGDVLVIRASRDELLAIRDAEGISILPEVAHGLGGADGPTVRVEAIVAPGARIEGATLAESQFRQRFNAVVLAVKKRERLFLRRLARLELEAGDTLLISGPAGSIDQLKSGQDLIITEELQEEHFRRRHIPVVLATVAAVVVLATIDLLPILVASLLGVVVVVGTGALKAHEVHAAVRWDVIFLLAGIIPLGIAMQKSGAAALLASAVVERSAQLAPVWVLAIFYVTTMLLTQIMSNNASVAVMIPIAAGAAEALSLNPVPFILACTFAASMEFMTPIGYQTNLMVYSVGEYRFTDYARVGLPLNLITGVVAVYALSVHWPLGT